MPARVSARLRLLIFLSLLVVVIIVLASLIYFRAGPRVPEGADVVRAQVGGMSVALTFGHHRRWAVGMVRDLRSLLALGDKLLGRQQRKGESGK